MTWLLIDSWLLAKTKAKYVIQWIAMQSKKTMYDAVFAKVNAIDAMI